METVSIIIPVYNTSEYIEHCIKSALNQTYKEIEFIIINDGSTDNSQKILEKIVKVDARVKLYKFAERRGVGSARNFGIEKATGTFIYFLDSDDYLEENSISYLVKYIGENKIIRGRMRNTDLSSSFVVFFEGLFSPKLYIDNRYNLIKNNSVNNFLFKKEFITQNNFAFSEKITVYSDLYFLIPALYNVNLVPYLDEAVYFRRRRNDPINNPSLRQLDLELRIHEYTTMYMDLKNKYDEPLINNFLDKHFLNFYRKEIVPFLTKNTRIDSLFPIINKITNRIDSDLLATYDWVLKVELNAIRSGKINKFKRINKRHHFLRDLKVALSSRKQLYIFLYKWFFLKLPIKKKLVFFESFMGKSYSDSPKYIYEYMLKNNYHYRYVWSFGKDTNIPGNARKVTRFSLSYFYHLARAKYWISNSRLPIYLAKREGNVYLQTWHGTPLKQLVFDIKDIYSADPKYKENFYKQSRRWDYLSSPNQYSSDIFRRAFKYEKEVLEFGYPRNDILYLNSNIKHINSLKRSLNLPLNKKVILYAPTWRDDDFYARGKYNFALRLNLELLQERLGDQYIILLRMHYFIANKIDLTAYKGFAYDFSDYNDIAELYLVSDILITDYSSVLFDYANLKRPILFYAYDLDKYRDQLRGFYLDIEKDVPGPILKTSKEVVEAIKNIDEVKEVYSKKYEEFYQSFCSWDDGKASEKTVKTVFEKG